MRSRRRWDRWAGESLSYLYGFADYVSVASRRAQAASRAAALHKKGRALAPVVIEGRRIATTFWGESWCDNLERYSDFANRLPRGRSYARNGSVIDLQMAPGLVTALVSGSDLYKVRVQVHALPPSRWQAVCRDVSGAIDSVIELLQGRLSDHVMTRLCAEGTGLFPAPREIEFTCSCPDGAWMCKHVAAVLYGVGARLDREPGLLFTLRQVKEADMVGGAGARAAAALVSGRGHAPGTRRIADESSLSNVFGIDVASEAASGPSAGLASAAGPPTTGAAARDRKKAAAPKAKPKTSTKNTKRKKKAKAAVPAANPSTRLTNAERERLRKAWAARRRAAKGTSLTRRPR